MKFLFGDSHVALLSKFLKSDQPEGWKFLGVGGATCAGLMNDESRTQARTQFKLTFEPGDHVVIMLGECDVVDRQRKDPSSLDRGITELFRFRDELVSSGSHVTLCTMIPHTAIFCIYGVKPSDHRDSIERWNSMLDQAIDIYTPLLGADRYLPEDICHSIKSDDERHLNKDGYLRLWDVIKVSPLI